MNKEQFYNAVKEKVGIELSEDFRKSSIVNTMI